VDHRIDALDLSAFPAAHGSDPFADIAGQLAGLNSSIKSILGVDHPVLEKVASYFFDLDGGGGKGALVRRIGMLVRGALVQEACCVSSRLPHRLMLHGYF
jgi:hypothetical protein